MAGVDEVQEAVSRLGLNEDGEGYDDETDGEDDGEPPVILGFVQKPTQPWSLSRQFFPSKAGGTPAWLDPVHLPTGADTCCGICQKPLQFLMQVYAPIDGNPNAFHRTLFVFICPNMACLQQHQCHQMEGLAQKKSHQSLKVFRCQLSRVNDYYPKDPPKYDGSDVPTLEGALLCSWCGTWKGEKVCSGCMTARYCSRSHQLEHWRATHGEICRSEARRTERNCSVEETGFTIPASDKLWCEFEIIDDEEGPDEGSLGNASLALVPNVEEDDFSRQFLAVECSGDQQHWANFQARISRAPGQVMRYCRSSDARPLWPQLNGKLDVKNVPVCPWCKGPRIFEFQILPQLLYYFRAANEPDSFDWGTIAIYCCEASCTSSKVYIEEFAWVQTA